MIKTEPTYKSNRTYSWLSNKVFVKNTTKYGMGVYSIEKIPKNENIAVFGGYVMTRKEEEEASSDVYDNAIQIDENLVIGAKSQDGIEDASMFNHSCDANAGIKGQIILVAMRDIEIGEQITFDFGTVLFHPEEAKPYKFKCLCESKACRGIITDEDWKNKELQKKYDGFFSLHIQEKINNLKSKL